MKKIPKYREYVKRKEVRRIIKKVLLNNNLIKNYFFSNTDKNFNILIIIKKILI